MGQILTEEAVILYDPIQTIFDVLTVGGHTSQQQEVISGEYEPDRSQTPMTLVPTLMVTDPNRGIEGVEKIGECTVEWRLLSSAGAEREIGTNDPYAIDGKSLVVEANIEAGQVQNVIVRVSYPDSYTGKNLDFERKISLTTSAKKSFEPAVSLDIPPLLTVNPFHLADGATRVVTASFFAGKTDISTNPRIVYVWEKKEGNAYRAITEADADVASIATRTVTINGTQTTVHYRTMTLRLDCIGQCRYRCTAYHADITDSQFVVSQTFAVDRKLYGARPGIAITKGKYLKGDTKESTAEFVLHVNSNLVNNPEKYYRVKWNFFRLSGQTRLNEEVLGWGMSVTVDRSKSGTDKTKRPTFEAIPYELTEFQFLTYNGEFVTYNGGKILGQAYNV